jgi:hypothetical protein
LIFAYGKEQRVLVLNPFDEINRPKVAYAVPEILEPARSSKEGLGELSKRMGNSEAVCKRHYLETLTREEGKGRFALRRSTGAP